MRLTRYLTEQVTFRDESTGSYSGQTNMKLIAYVDNNQVGYIDYVVYGDEVSISMIEGSPKHKGIGRQLVLKLQSMYPKTEIKWGNMTGPGFKLFNSLKGKLYVDKGKIARIKRLKAEYAKLKAIEDKATKTNNWENWDNEIYDRMYEIEETLYELER
jgi:hypothetical protein